MQELLQALKTPTQTQKASSQSLLAPRQSRSDHLQRRRETSHEQKSKDAKGKNHVVEQPPASIGHRQFSTHGLVNGQDSNDQIIHQTIPMPMSNAGCFGGVSVFQAMIRPSSVLHGFMPDNAYGAMQAGTSNPMYGTIGVSVCCWQLWDAWNQHGHGWFFTAICTKPECDSNLMQPLLVGITESSKIRKAATFPKTNVLQWWTTMLNQVNCESLEDYNAKFWDTLLLEYHGMPQSIVSEMDPHMKSLFWKALFENMGTTLKFSSSFHPQIGGQSKEANSTVLDLLKCYVSEHKAIWEHNLLLAEYAYNNTVHTSTGKAPFEIVERGKKVPPILLTKDKIFEADKYVQNTDEAYRNIKLALEKTQSKQKKAADRHRRELVLSLGDWIVLRFEKARLRKMKGKERLFPKLGMRYYGPFQVYDKISNVAYRLKLPEGWKIHNAFHVSLLRPFVGDVPEDTVSGNSLKWKN
ncbi:hypothetical protein L7F22_066308 [Adiantum nelumboides]|nr:hypothetical protein [Adiantum nelumboides]